MVQNLVAVSENYAFSIELCCNSCLVTHTVGYDIISFFSSKFSAFIRKLTQKAIDTLKYILLYRLPVRVYGNHWHKQAPGKCLLIEILMAEGLARGEAFCIVLSCSLFGALLAWLQCRWVIDEVWELPKVSQRLSCSMFSFGVQVSWGKNVRQWPQN